VHAEEVHSKVPVDGASPAPHTLQTSREPYEWWCTDETLTPTSKSDYVGRDAPCLP
jgi:hypothetical protein